MSEEPIYCFNGNECCYNIETQCIFYQGSKDKGTCLLEPMKEPLKGGTPAPVAQTPTETPKEQSSLTAFPKLEEGKFIKEIEGELKDDPVQRDVDTSRGTVTVTNFRLTDGVTEVRVSLWEDLAEEVMDFVAGNSIKLTNMSIKEPYDGLMQISSTRPNPKKKFPGTEIK